MPETVNLVVKAGGLTGAERKSLCEAGATQRDGSMVMKFSRVPEETLKALLARGGALEGELVVPVLIGQATTEYKPTSIYAAQNGIPKALRIKKHQIDLAFAVRAGLDQLSPLATPSAAHNARRLNLPNIGDRL